MKKQLSKSSQAQSQAFLNADQSCASNLTDSEVNLKVRELTGTWGAVGIEMPKFEAKKGDFAKIWQKLGATAPQLHCP